MHPAPVAIIGGGPAGSAAAIELRRSGFSVMVFERSHYESMRIGESVPPSIRQILAELRLPDALVATHSESCHGIWSSWGSDEIFEKSFMFSPYGHGWHVDRRTFDESLAESAKSSGAALLCDSQIHGFQPIGNGDWQVTFRGPCGTETRTASFLIDASGRSSTVGTRLGAVRTVFDRQIGIAQRFSAEGDTVALDPVTLVEAAEYGWWYSAPIPGRSLIVAYLTDMDLYPHSSSGDSGASWLELLQATRHTFARVQGLVPSGKRMTTMADTYRVRAGPNCAGWLNAGAAAMGLDPLSSDGICFALRSGRDAARAVAAYLGGDPNATKSFCFALDEYFDRYLAQRSRFYEAEERWPHSAFWLRRRRRLTAAIETAGEAG